MSGLPSFAALDFVDGVRVDSIFSGQLGTGLANRETLPDGRDIPVTESALRSVGSRRLRNVAPSQTNGRRSHVDRADSVAFGEIRERSTSGAQSSDFNYVRLGQHCAPMPGAAPICLPAFLPHVGDVVGLCAKEQVVGVAARGVVAPVKDLHARRNGKAGEYPNNSTDVLLARRGLGAGHSIAAPVSGALPLPAPGGSDETSGQYIGDGVDSGPVFTWHGMYLTHNIVGAS